MVKVFVLNIEKIRGVPVSCALPFGEAEVQRLNKINNSERRDESLGGLIALKKLLAIHGISADTKIVRHSNGKPSFADTNAPQFSISHSKGFCAAAVGDGNIGVDIEVIDPRFDTSRIADRFFTQEEKAQLERSADPLLTFYRIWTAKEARAKVFGDGLSKIMANKQNGELYIWQRILAVKDKQLAISLCTDIKDFSVEIHCEDEYEIQD
jgi:phosphopantetheine--protein transferase-like protein